MCRPDWGARLSISSRVSFIIPCHTWPEGIIRQMQRHKYSPSEEHASPNCLIVPVSIAQYSVYKVPSLPEVYKVPSAKHVFLYIPQFSGIPLANSIQSYLIEITDKVLLRRRNGLHWRVGSPKVQNNTPSLLPLVLPSDTIVFVLLEQVLKFLSLSFLSPPQHSDVIEIWLVEVKTSKNDPVAATGHWQCSLHMPHVDF